MRIIAGTRRGKTLIHKVDEITRPTTDRVRESVFNVLAGIVDMNDAKVLDLFAGCGAYGLESYSRGAVEVIFNDQDKNAIEVIKKNCASTGCGAVVYNLDFRAALEKLGKEQFNIIFLDPPYESDFAYEALGIITKQNMLADKGVIVIETERELEVPFIKFKKYGRALLYFLG